MKKDEMAQKIRSSNLDDSTKKYIDTLLLDNSGRPEKIDIKTTRLVISILGLILFITVCVASYMSVNGQANEIPDILIAVSSASVGALAGLIGGRERG